MPFFKPSGAPAANTGWRALLNADLKAQGNVSLAGASSVSIDGYSMAWEESGTWSGGGQLALVAGVGLVIDPSANGVNSAWFAPSLADLASHFELTLHPDDHWAAVLSFASFVKTQTDSFVMVSIGEDPLGYWSRAIYGRLAGDNAFRVDNNQSPGASPITIAGVQSIGLQAHPNGMGALARYATSETRDWADLSGKGSIYPGSVPTQIDSDGEDQAHTLAKFNRIGAEFTNGQPDSVVLTGLGIHYCPRLGA